MKDYLIGAFAMAAVISFCSLLAYKKGKATRFAFATLLIYVTLSPVLSLIPGLSEIDLSELGAVVDYDEGEYENTIEQAFCRGIEALLCAELNISSELVRVACYEFDLMNMTAERVEVRLFGSAIGADALKIEDIVEGNGFGECVIEIEM